MLTLTASGIKKSFGETRVLEGLDLVCYSGEIHGLLGQNGSGKSTFTKILGGLLPPDAGKISVDDHPIHERRRKHQFADVQIVFQELSLLSDMTVAENLLLSREPSKWGGWISRKKLNRIAEEKLHFIGLEGINPKLPVSALSLPERQLVEVARALIRNPHILILDEATSSLGPNESEWVFSQARNVADHGGIVLFTSHRFQEIERHADRMSVLREGIRVLETGRGETQIKDLIAAMLGYRVEQVYPAHTWTHGETILEVESFGVRNRIRGIQFRVRSGEVVGVASMPGQGQRELFYGLFGAMKSTGFLRIDGREATISSPRSALRNGLALVPEDRKIEGLVLPMSITSNLTMAIMKRLSRFGLRRRSKEMELAMQQGDTFKLPKNRMNLGVEHLSGGNQQKVVLGKLLLTHPRCVLLFDCTRGIDIGTKAEIYKEIVQLASDGVGVLFYSSDLQELSNLCDRVIVLYEGKIVRELVYPSISEDELLHHALGAVHSV
ncbi:MAG: sugar ABC transporter ATP-binding protein [Bacilli bacterium]